MIVIKVRSSSHEFIYDGNIEIQYEEPFITIVADKIFKPITDDELITYSTNIYDKFWSDDVESIISS